MNRLGGSVSGAYDRVCELAREGKLRGTVVAVNVAEDAPVRQVEPDAQGKTLRDYLWLAAWHGLREDRPVFAAAPEHCENLAGELSSMRYGTDNSGRLVVENKDAMKARRLRSPDLADALTLTFFTPSRRARRRFLPVGQ